MTQQANMNLNRHPKTLSNIVIDKQWSGPLCSSIDGSSVLLLSGMIIHTRLEVYPEGGEGRKEA